MKHWCYRCNGAGTIKDLSAKWWQFWKQMKCPVCKGEGIILPGSINPEMPTTQPGNVLSKPTSVIPVLDRINQSASEIRKRYNQIVKETKMFKFENGEILKDKVTGFKGVVLGRTDYFTGCNHYGLCSQSLKDEEPVAWHWFDETRLTRVEGTRKIVQEPLTPTSGLEPNAPQM